MDYNFVNIEVVGEKKMMITWTSVYMCVQLCRCVCPNQLSNKKIIKWGHENEIIQSIPLLFPFSHIYQYICYKVILKSGVTIKMRHLCAC